MPPNHAENLLQCPINWLVVGVLFPGRYMDTDSTIRLLLIYMGERNRSSETILRMWSITRNFQLPGCTMKDVTRKGTFTLKKQSFGSTMNFSLHTQLMIRRQIYTTTFFQGYHVPWSGGGKCLRIHNKPYIKYRSLKPCSTTA